MATQSFAAGNVLRCCPKIAEMSGLEPPEGTSVGECERCSEPIYLPPRSMVPLVSAGRNVNHICFDCRDLIEEANTPGSLKTATFYGPNHQNQN